MPAFLSVRPVPLFFSLTTNCLTHDYPSRTNLFYCKRHWEWFQRPPYFVIMKFVFSYRLEKVNVVNSISQIKLRLCFHTCPIWICFMPLTQFQPIKEGSRLHVYHCLIINRTHFRCNLNLNTKISFLQIHAKIPSDWRQPFCSGMRLLKVVTVGLWRMTDIVNNFLQMNNEKTQKQSSIFCVLY